MLSHRFKKYSKNIVSQDMVLACQPNQIAEIPIFLNGRVLPRISSQKELSRGDKRHFHRQNSQNREPLPLYVKEGGTQKSTFFSESLCNWHMLLQRGTLNCTGLGGDYKKDSFSQVEKRSEMCRVSMQNRSLWRSLERWHAFALPYDALTFYFESYMNLYWKSSFQQKSYHTQTSLIQKQSLSTNRVPGQGNNRNTQKQSESLALLKIVRVNESLQKSRDTRILVSVDEIVSKSRRSQIANVFFYSAFGFIGSKQEDLDRVYTQYESSIFTPIVKFTFYRKLSLQTYLSKDAHLVNVFLSRKSMQKALIKSFMPRKGHIFSELFKDKSLFKKDLFTFFSVPSLHNERINVFESVYSNILRSPEIQEIAQLGVVSLQGGFCLRVSVW